MLALRTVTYCTENEETPVPRRAGGTRVAARTVLQGGLQGKRQGVRERQAGGRPPGADRVGARRSGGRNRLQAAARVAEDVHVPEAVPGATGRLAEIIQSR